MGHINEDHVVPELQLLERPDRLMMTLVAEAMHSQGVFATRSGMANSLCGLATWHVRRIAVS